MTLEHQAVRQAKFPSVSQVCAHSVCPSQMSHKCPAGSYQRAKVLISSFFMSLQMPALPFPDPMVS